MASVSPTSLIKPIASASNINNTPTDAATDPFGAVLNSANEASSSATADALSSGSTHEEKQETKDENATAMAGALAALLNQVNTRETELSSNSTVALSGLKNTESNLKLADAAVAKAMQNADLVGALNDESRKLAPATTPTSVDTTGTVSPSAISASALQINTTGNEVANQSPLNNLKLTIPPHLLSSTLASNRAETEINHPAPSEALAVNPEFLRQSLLHPAPNHASPINLIRPEGIVNAEPSIDASTMAQNATLRAFSSQSIRSIAATAQKTDVKTPPQFNSAAIGSAISPPTAAPQGSPPVEADNADAALMTDVSKISVADSRPLLTQPQTSDASNAYQFITHNSNINNIYIEQKAPSNTQTPQFTLSDTPGSIAWNQSFGDRVVWLAGQQMQQARLQLHPKELGQVDVNLKIESGSVIATFGVQHAAAAAAVQNALPHLHTLLEQQGLTLGQATVSHQDANQSGAHTSNQKPAIEFQVTEIRSENREANQSTTKRTPVGLLDDFA